MFVLSGIVWKQDLMVVYPGHGVGRIQAIETREMAGESLEVLVILFERGMTLTLPIGKAGKSGLRTVISSSEMSASLLNLKARKRPGKTMWMKRAREYNDKINSGHPDALIEVISELATGGDKLDRSQGERQLYDVAIERLAREYAAVEGIALDVAITRLNEIVAA